ncbi:MAG: 50S ribosomal protein L24e [Candidatus Bathyarchaeota archaeon]|nr:MAG: 50S ribosomal protein L24e [Candidatus Bathyarchaeota archaeon]
MPKIHKCSFCGVEFPQGVGLMYVKNDGTVYWFCSSKCRKAQLILKRDARKLKWTSHYPRERRASLV